MISLSSSSFVKIISPLATRFTRLASVKSTKETHNTSSTTNCNDIMSTKRSRKQQIKPTTTNKMISNWNLTAIVLLTLTCCLGNGNQPRDSGINDNYDDRRAAWSMVAAQSMNDQQQQQSHHLMSYQQQLALLANQQPESANLISQQQPVAPGLSASQNPQPGHYEFEVAPKLEPPSVRKPPYKASIFSCAGADPFDGFSPKNNLCGDLNQGYIPLNPIGQNVADQAYPFEVIKNKTLQFLARALPFLRLESETIPKVARYLPPNHLLNPTNLHSPLASQHMSQLNQAVSPTAATALAPQLQVSSGQQTTLLSPMDSMALNSFMDHSVPYLRRRKRYSQTEITVAELSPNATLVVSSAHSPGRIVGGNNHHHLHLSSNGGNHHLHHNPRYHPNHQLASASASQSFSVSGNPAIQQANVSVVTKDGYKAVNAAHVVVSPLQNRQQNQQQQPHEHTTDTINTSNSSTSNGYSGNNNKLVTSNLLAIENNGISSNGHDFAKRAAPSGSSSAPASGASIAKRVNPAATQQPHANLANSQTGHSQQVQIGQPAAARAAPQSIDSAAIAVTAQAASGHGHHHHNNHHQQRTSSAEAATAPPSAASVQKRSSGGSSVDVSESIGETVSEFVAQKSNSAAQESQSRSSLQQHKTSEPQQHQQQQSMGSPHQARETQQQQQQQQKSERKRSGGCDGLGSWSTAICKAAAALIEPSEPAPTWLQIAKTLSSAYSGASDNMDRAPIWSLLSSALIPHESDQNNAKSADLSGKPNSLAHSARQNLISMLNPLISLLTSSPPTPKDSSGVHHAPQQNSGNDQGASSGSSGSSSAVVKDLKEQQAGALANAMFNVALTGWATNAVTSLVQYFMPSAFQNARSSFARRKKPFEAGEQFVDTPASPLATSSGLPHLTGGGKQLPTPCPSVEEYISPTFARNYQGQWKYVVQIPAEGYFTQTIQRTSCARQKCEFTEGVCHESPRWVSLLVAEIYYPDAIIGGSGMTNSIEDAMSAGSAGSPSMQGGGQQMAASSRHYQQMAMQQHQILPQAQTQQLQAQAMQLQLQQQQQQQQQPKSSITNAQDLQMTDSLNAYDHNNLQAMFNAANEMGLDPTNVNQMRQLANNYQLVQRYGSMSPVQQSQIQQQQQQMAVAESRSSPSIVNAQGQLVNGLSGSGSSTLFNGYTNDQVLSMAAAMLQQNPTMNINDLIASLQMQTSQQAHRRKRRDVVMANGNTNNSNNRQQQQVGPHQQTVNAQQAQFSNYKPSVQQIQVTDQQVAAAVAKAQQQQQRPIAPSMEQIHAAQGQAIDASQSTPPMATTTSTSDGSQECDGRDKFGCYIVRVYYDWFLVNGSCKCWKTTPQSSGASDRQQQSGNSFLRRIFTG